MKLKWPSVTALAVLIVSLAVGASFHGCRMHPENVEFYNLGVKMGIIMASIAAAALVVFLILLVCGKLRKKR